MACMVASVRSPLRVEGVPVLIASALLLLLLCACAANQQKPAPLAFSTSGRLSAGIDGFKLGMSIPDVLRVDPDLENFDYGKPTTRNGWLWSKSHVGFTDQLGLTAGRLIWIDSTGAAASRADAVAFEQSVLSNFGKPDTEESGERGSEHWVWIDGDVRVVYTNSPVTRIGSEGPRYLNLKTAIFPLWMSAIEKSAPTVGTAAVTAARKVVSEERQSWGDEPPSGVRAVHRAP